MRWHIPFFFSWLTNLTYPLPGKLLKKLNYI